MPRAARSSPMSRASGTERASRSSFGHDEGVAGAHRRQCLVQAGAGAVGAGEAVVEVDPVLGDAEFAQPLPLCGEVLRVGGATRIPDKDSAAGHDPTVTDSHPSMRIFAYQVSETRPSCRRSTVSWSRCPFGVPLRTGGLERQGPRIDMPVFPPNPRLGSVASPLSSLAGRPLGISREPWPCGRTRHRSVP